MEARPEDDFGPRFYREGTTGGGRILVIDDDEQVRYLLRYLLTHEGFEVDDASTREEAFDRMTANVPDVVLLDLHLSGRAGHEAIPMLRSDPRTRFVPVVMITGGATRKDKLDAIAAGVTDFLAKPFDGEELVARVRNLVRLKRYTDAFEEAQQVIIALAATIDARDPYTAGHSERVSYYAELLGRAVGVSSEEQRLLHFGGLFHDIGKIAIRDSVLLKPGKLTPDEFKEIRRHPVVGRDLLRDMRTLDAAIPIVYHHHERFDGSGYPEGLAGEAIPLLARIASIADVYDALTTSRPYRGAMTRAEALEVMEDERQKGWWDPDLFDEFRAALQVLPEGFLPGGEEA
ncbi:MAG: HD domain-containing phosphohydrolase [Candidatus Eisenbacteria bacterium]